MFLGIWKWPFFEIQIFAPIKHRILQNQTEPITDLETKKTACKGHKGIHLCVFSIPFLTVSTYFGVQFDYWGGSRQAHTNLNSVNRLNPAKEAEDILEKVTLLIVKLFWPRTFCVRSNPFRNFCMNLYSHFTTFHLAILRYFEN